MNVGDAGYLAHLGRVAEEDARPTQAVYEAVITERNARFVDTDGDGLTDVKEGELETDAAIETIFYLQAAYNSAVAASNSEGRQAGRADVTGNPANFDLTTVGAFNICLVYTSDPPTEEVCEAVVTESIAQIDDTEWNVCAA